MPPSLLPPSSATAAGTAAAAADQNWAEMYLQHDDEVGENCSLSRFLSLMCVVYVGLTCVCTVLAGGNDVHKICNMCI